MAHAVLYPRMTIAVSRWRELVSPVSARGTKENAMDWAMMVVYLVCAVFLLYVAGLLRGLYYEFSHSDAKLREKNHLMNSLAQQDPAKP
jgi:hypothetical protein